MSEEAKSWMGIWGTVGVSVLAVVLAIALLSPGCEQGYAQAKKMRAEACVTLCGAGNVVAPVSNSDCGCIVRGSP